MDPGRTFTLCFTPKGDKLCSSGGDFTLCRVCGRCEEWRGVASDEALFASWTVVDGCHNFSIYRQFTGSEL
eukprot:scaffold140620_cov178-Phaeocystis_antarctica.AAC.1